MATTAFLDLIPVVPYEDIRVGHDFLVDVLGFTSAGLVEDGDGTVSTARCAPVISASGSTRRRAGSPHPGRRVRRAAASWCTWPTSTRTSTHVEASGATILRPPTDEDYGQREYGVQDPEGHAWYIATPTTS